MKRKLVWVGAVGVVGVGLAGWFFLSTQAEDSSHVGTRVAPPPAPTASAPVVSGTKRFAIAETGKATFLIDAPLEKIKGRWTKFRGNLDVDPNDLTKSSGEVDLDLDDLKTETFDDKEKNLAQTEHAHNWLEIGTDVSAKSREENRWARFTIKAIEQASYAKIADAPEVGGERSVKVTARGDMWLHGITSAKTVKLTVTFGGPATAPTSVRIVSDEPIRISLKEHDVKPRDVAGKFLNGALEKVGKKIEDTAQISLNLTGRPSTTKLAGQP